MQLSLIVPTYRRPSDLKRTLESVALQESPLDQIVVVIGPGDKESHQVCEDRKDKLPALTIVHAEKPSVIHALNLGLKTAKGDIICLTDDDVWFPADWSKKVRQAYASDDSLGAYGGQDRIQYEKKTDISNPPPSKYVGTFKWNGSLVGNHHCGVQVSPSNVDVLKGVNLSFRRSAFPLLQIDSALENRGAEPAFEIDICLGIKKAGYNVVYDNDNHLLHFGSPRQGDDIREDLFSPTSSLRIFNDAYVRAKFRPVSEMIFFIFSSFLIGSRFQPGIAWSAFHLGKQGVKAIILPYRKFKYLWKGTVNGWSARGGIQYK